MQAINPNRTGKKLVNYIFTKDSALYVLFYGILVLLLVPVLGQMVFSNDIFKALYSGRYLSWFHQFPHHSTFTFSPVLDHLIRNSFNWLGNLVLISIYRSGGFTGLQILRGVILLFSIALVHSLFDWNRNPIFLILFFFLAMGVSQKLLLRTAIFTVPGLTLLLWGWIRARYFGHVRLIWLLPVVLLLWSQLHGSYLIGLGLLILLTTGDLLDRIISSRANLLEGLIRLGGILFLSLLATTFVKPFPDYSFAKKTQSIINRVFYGTINESQSKSKDNVVVNSTIGKPLSLPSIREAYGLSSTPLEQKDEVTTWYHVLKYQLQNTVFPKKSFRSTEFKFPLEQMQFLSIRSSLFLGLSILFLFLLPPYRYGFSLWIPLLPFLILGLSYSRTAAYMGLVPVILFSIQYRHVNPKILWNPWLIYTSFLAISLLLGNSVSLIFNGNISKLTGNPGHQLGYGRHLRMNPKIPNFIQRKYPNQRFFNSYETGSYLIWKWWPHKKVFVDTKFSAYAPKFRRFISETPLPDILRRENLNHAVFERSHFWHYYFNDQKNWQPLVTDPFFSVYFRRSKMET